MASIGPVASVWRPIAGGISVAVKVQPKARRPGLQGIMQSADGPRLRIAVNEAAEDGKANRATCVTLARALGVSASAIRVVVGLSNREKLLHVSGDPEALSATLEAL